MFKKRLFTFTVPLSNLVYKRIPVNLIPGDSPAAITLYLFQGGVEMFLPVVAPSTVCAAIVECT